MQRAVLGALILPLVASCDRKRESAPVAVTTPKPAVTAPTNACTLAPLPLVVPGTPRRTVAIGDLHGDLAATRSALRAAGAIDARDHWSGGDLIVVQTGDILDRGDDESKIIDLFDALSAQAQAAGGQIVVLNGNHELMNAAHDFRYVTPGGMSDFGGERAKALAPGGTWARRLAAHNIVAVVDGTVYSHAGVTPEWVTHLDAENLAARCWLDGQAGGADEPPRMLSSENSPVWTRLYGIPDQVDCGVLDGVLAKLGAKRMVVGHTVQQQGITSACDGKLWRIDVGLAAGYGGPIEVLEVNPTPRILRGERSPQTK